MEKKMNEIYDTYKLLILGETAVGKTSILRWFRNFEFDNDHFVTIGIDIQFKDIVVKGKTIRLVIWDTAGQERFRSISTNLFKGKDGIALVYDVTDKKSFSKISYWIEEIKSNITEEDISLVLLGNKCDIEKRGVSREDVQKMEKELKISNTILLLVLHILNNL